MNTTLAKLEQAVPDNGIGSVNFFNGRLLTGADLRREQEARRDADRLTTMAAGHGVAWGLEVAAPVLGAAGADNPDGPLVRVQPGLAVASDGTLLHLAQPVEVPIARKPPTRGSNQRSFDACQRMKGGAYATTPGTYLLVLAPASLREGLALTHALDDAALPCNSDLQRATVCLRLLPLGPLLGEEALAVEQRPLTTQQRSSVYRNRVAMRCLGVDALAAFLADPLRASLADYGLLANLPASTLRECEVPLAVIQVDIGIDWVDPWAVRRRLTRADSASALLGAFSDRRLAEGEAMLQQFQQHLAGLLTPQQPALGAFSAVANFDFLPPAGVLPMPTSRSDFAAATQIFFGGLTTRGPAFIEGARLPALLRDALRYPPIDLASGELIWLYELRENRQWLDSRLTPAPTPCLVFTTGHMPYQADARMNLAHWDYANTALDA